MCPTRWVLRFEGLAAFMENYVNILDWLGDVVTSNDFDLVTVADAQSYLCSLQNFTIFISLRTLHNLLAIINLLHVKVQLQSMCLGSFKSALEDVLVLINANIAQRAQRARDFFDGSSRIAASSGIDLPSLPRIGRRSSSVLQISSDNDAVSEYFVNLYGKVYETASTAITSRF